PYRFPPNPPLSRCVRPLMGDPCGVPQTSLNWGTPAASPKPPLNWGTPAAFPKPPLNWGTPAAFPKPPLNLGTPIGFPQTPSFGRRRYTVPKSPQRDCKIAISAGPAVSVFRIRAPRPATCQPLARAASTSRRSSPPSGPTSSATRRGGLTSA